MTELRADQSQFAFLKSAIEQLLGHSEFLKIKESADFPRWRKTVARLLAAIEMAISATVEVADHEWVEEATSILAHGKATIATSKSPDELFANFSATLVLLSFLQIGLVPSRYRETKPVALRPENWRLNRFRSVQYVQSKSQKANLQAHLERRNAMRARVHEE